MMRSLLLILGFFYLNIYAQYENYKWVYTPDNPNEVFLIDQIIPVTKDSGYIIQGRVRGKTDLNFSKKPSDTASFNFKKETYFIGKYNKDFALIWIKFLRIEDPTNKNFSILITSDIHGNNYWVVNHDNTVRFIEGNSSMLLPGNYNIIKTDLKGTSSLLHTSANTPDKYLFIYDLYADSFIYFNFYNTGNIDLNLNMNDAFHHTSKYYFFKYFSSKYDLNFKMTEVFYDTFNIYTNLYRDHKGNSYQFSQIKLPKDSLVKFDFKNPNGTLGGYNGFNYYLTKYDKDMKLLGQRRFLGKTPAKGYDLMHIYPFYYDKDNNMYLTGTVVDTFNFQLDVTKPPQYIQPNSIIFAKYDENFNLKWIKNWPNCNLFYQILNPFSSNKIALSISGYSKYFLDPGTNKIEVKSGTSMVEFDLQGNLTKYLLPNPLLSNMTMFRSYDSSLLLFSKLEGILNIGTAQKENFIAGLHKSIIMNITDEKPLQSNFSYNTATESLVSMYPNPASDAIKIVSKTSIYSAEILDAEGKTACEINNFDQTKPVSIGHLQNGIYIVKLTDANKIIHCMRLVKI